MQMPLVKDLEMKIILNRSDWCPEKEKTQRHTDGRVRKEVETAKCLQAKDHWVAQELKQAGRFFPRAFRGAGPCGHLDFRII